MGTNYYFMSRNKKFVQDYFVDEDEEYAIVDEPYLGYQIHLNKLSCGWRPLFQKHKVFETFKQLMDFYIKHEKDLEIYDEYGKMYIWEEYHQIVMEHSSQKRTPIKWVYEVDEMFKPLGDDRPTLHFIECEEKDAEIYVPIEHELYQRSEKEAIEKFGVSRNYDFELCLKYWKDPDYPIDWTEGDFC